MGQTCTKDTDDGHNGGTSSAATNATTLNSTHDEFRYLALGDSYTIGYGVSPKERYPIQLERKLIETHSKKIRSITTTIIARTGWTTKDLLNTILTDKRSLLEVQIPYGLLTICIGSNNQYQGQDIGTYEKELQQLLQHCLTLVANNDPRRIYVLSIPDYSYTPFGNDKIDNKQQKSIISNEIDLYNKSAQKVCLQYNIKFIDTITKLSRNKRISKLVLKSGGDGLHPNGEQYNKWITSFYKQIQLMIVKHDIP